MGDRKRPLTLLHMGILSAPNLPFESIAAKRAADTAEVAKFGITVTEHWISLEASDIKDPSVSTKFPSLIEAATKVFRSQSWDIVSIGGGVRGPHELTGLFEGLVNVAATLDPVPVFMFATKPDGDIEALRRTYGDVIDTWR